MAREVEPPRPAGRAPRGCLLAFGTGVLLLVALVVLGALLLRPMAGR